MGRPRKTFSLEEKLEKVNEEIEMYTEKIKSLKKRENWKKTWRIKKGRIVSGCYAVGENDRWSFRSYERK